MSAALGDKLAEELDVLREHSVLAIVEAGRVGIRIWKIRRDSAGIARCKKWRPVPWLALDHNGDLDESKLREAVLPALKAQEVLVVCSSADGARAVEACTKLEAHFPGAPGFTLPDELERVLVQALANDRLHRFYELVLIRPSASGRVELAGRQLFPQDATRGESVEVTVRCEPTDGEPITFAVVARMPGRRFGLVSMSSVSNIGPGNLTVTAELLRPTQVRFSGLAQRFEPETRSWAEIVATLPKRVDVYRPAHLIFLVEITGPNQKVARRLKRVSQLLGVGPGSARGSQLISLITYGSHAIGRVIPEEPVRVLVWAGSGSDAIDKIEELEAEIERRADDEEILGYPDAAQLECVLHEVISKLGRSQDRCVLVTVGARAAHPARRQVRAGIIPCPAKRSWAAELAQIRGLCPDVAFGAILDDVPGDAIWAELSRDALAYGATVDVRPVAHKLGLLSSATDHLPFPLLDE